MFAKKDIKRGDVLFVEKAFAFAPFIPVAIVAVRVSNFANSFVSPVSVQPSCQYCLALLTSCVP